MLCDCREFFLRLTMVIAVSRAKRLTSMPTSPSNVATINGGVRRATASNAESRVFAWSFAADAMSPPMPVAASPTSAVTV